MDCDPINSRQWANSLKFNQTKCWRFVTSLPPLALPIFHSSHHVFVHVDFHHHARWGGKSVENGKRDPMTKMFLDQNSWAAGINLIPHRLAAPACGCRFYCWISFQQRARVYLTGFQSSCEQKQCYSDVTHWCDKIYWKVQSGAAAPMAFVSCKLITRVGAIAQWHHSSMEPTSERKNHSHNALLAIRFIASFDSPVVALVVIFKLLLLDVCLSTVEYMFVEATLLFWNCATK